MSDFLDDAQADTDFAFADSLDANVDGTGGTISGKPVWDIDQIMANLNRTDYPGSGIPGPMWAYGTDYMAQNKSGDPDIIQFGFYTSRSQLFQVPYVFQQGAGLVGRSEYFGFSPFSAAQQDAARKALVLWDDLIKPKIVEVSDVNQADITYGNLTNAPGTQAYAYLPYNYGGTSAGLQGDVWVSLSQASNLQLDNGYYGLATLIHETGHTLGLQHPGAYNAAPGVSITYGANAEYYQDSRQYTQMSYFNAEFTGAAPIDWDRLTWVYGQTPLLHDIATIQAMYGADPTTRATDTVYGFNSTAGRDVYDFTTNKMPVISIYDAGGNDTLDFSGWSSDSVINLTPGSFSDGGGSGVVPLDVLKARGLLPASYTEDQYTALRARYNAVDGMLHENISIAYGTIIENAVGGAGNDTITGNDVDNHLVGNGGNDKVIGGLGNDTIDSGAGIDTASYANASGGVTVNLFAGTASGADGNDTLIAVENVVGSAFNDTLIGNSGDNALDGSAGVDTVSYANAAGSVNVNLALGTASGDGNDTLVSIENAIGSKFDDRIIGDANANRIQAGNGYDVVTLGGGNDTYVADQGAKVSTKAGMVSLDIITDFTTGQDKIDLSGLGSFNFRADAANKNVGDLTFKVYDSVNGAEHALGIDIHSHYTGELSGPVTVVFADTDHQAGADTAIILLNHNGVSGSDFLLAA